MTEERLIKVQLEPQIRKQSLYHGAPMEPRR